MPLHLRLQHRFGGPFLGCDTSRRRLDSGVYNVMCTGPEPPGLYPARVLAGLFFRQVGFASIAYDGAVVRCTRSPAAAFVPGVGG
jgi:hypothetical protein